MVGDLSVINEEIGIFSKSWQPEVLPINRVRTTRVRVQFGVCQRTLWRSVSRASFEPPLTEGYRYALGWGEHQGYHYWKKFSRVSSTTPCWDKPTCPSRDCT